MLLLNTIWNQKIAENGLRRSLPTYYPTNTSNIALVQSRSFYVTYIVLFFEMKNILILAFSLFLSGYAECANILAIVPCMNENRPTLYNQLWQRLADKNHNIVILTGTQLKPHKNIEQIDVSKDYRIKRKDNKKILYPIEDIEDIASKDYWIRQRLNASYAQKLKHYNFDLVFLELTVPFWSSIAAMYNVPLIGLNHNDASPVLHSYLGNPIHPSIYPNGEKYVNSPLDLPNRTVSTIETIYSLLFSNSYAEKVKKALHETYAPYLPSYTYMFSHMSLMFINANPIFYPPRPLAPTTVNLGGFLNIQKPENLPEVGISFYFFTYKKNFLQLVCHLTDTVDNVSILLFILQVVLGFHSATFEFIEN